MRLFNNRFFGSRKPKSCKPSAKLPRRSFQPTFEALEERAVPTVAMAVNESQFFNRNSWDWLQQTFQFTNAGVMASSPTVTMTNTFGLAVGEPVTVTDGTTTLNSSITGITPNASITLADIWQGSTGNMATVDDTQSETVGQLPFTLVDTDPGKFVLQASGTAVTIPNNTSSLPPPQTFVTVASTTGFSPGQFVQISDGSTPPLYSVIDSVSPNTLSIDDAWNGNSAVTVSVLDPLSSPGLTLCWDLQDFLSDRFESPPAPDTNIFSVLPTFPSGPGAPPNAGQVAYLYDQYGTFDINNAALDNAALSHAHVPPPALGTGTVAEAVGLQVAVWKLEYGSAFQDLQLLETAPGNANPNELADINTWANFYISDSASQSQGATFLQANGSLQSQLMGGGGNGGPDGQQGMLITPKLTTSASETAGGVVGSAVISDSATLTGTAQAGTPTPTLTFTLIAPNGNTVYTEIQTAAADGTYTTTGTGTGSEVATQVGTYYWVVSYSGNSFNSPVTDNGQNKPSEQEKTVPATPGINTSQQPPTATVGGVVADKATVAGGNNPTGTVTFNLYSNPNGTGMSLFTDTETLVNGMATSKGYTTTATGTDYWVATYNGDSNNKPVTSGTALEPVVIGPATPSINTSQQPATATVGSVVADKATVSGGFNPTGTVTFNLYNNPNGTGTSLFTDTEPLASGMATSKGYTTTATGTDYWVATYNGDSNNKSVTSGTALEPVVITPGGPTITTTPSKTTSGGGITISGTKYLDLTGNGFSSDDTSLSGVTINLYKESNGTGGLQTGSGGDTLVATTTTGTNGTYSFPVASPGTYYVQESVQSGNVQTGGGPSGSAGNTYYTIVATNGNAYGGYNFDDYQIPVCAPTNISYMITHNGYTTTVSTLAGNTHPGDTVKVTFSVPAGMSEQLTLVSYAAPGATFSDSNAYQQLIYQQATGTFAPGGPYMLTVQIPNSYYQIDFICGSAIDQLEPNQNNNAYGPDSAEILYHPEGRYIDADAGGSTAPTSLNTKSPIVPSPTTTSSPTTMKLNDSATLSGGMNPTGTITFYLFAPGVTPNSNNSNNVYSDVVTVSGNCTYTTAMGTNPGGYTPTVGGTFQWVAVYSGDSNNKGATSPFGSEPFTVGASPSISTSPNPTTVSLSATCGTTILKDTATLSGGTSPTGTITFTLYFNGGSTPVDTETVTVNGNGNYTTPKGYTLPTSGTVAGTYQWDATYSGDNSNAPATDLNNANEQVTVKPAGPTISTCPNPTTVSLGSCGSAGVILYDTATLQGGFNPTGTITFTLVGPGGTTVDTETVTVSGNGSYTTPHGYKIVSTSTAGTYQWDATYSSDGNNQTAIDNNNKNEQVTVTKPAPTITTCPSPSSVSLSSTCGTIVLKDTATLSGGINPTGTITFTLYFNGGSTPVDTETVTVTGAGNYTTPKGYTLPSSGTVAGKYQWDATYSGDSNDGPASDVNNPKEQVVVCQASPCITTCPTPTCVTLTSAGALLKDTATLSGGYRPGGTITFTLYGPSGTLLDTETVTVTANGNYTTPTGYTLAGTAATGTYQWDATYSGDGNNVSVSDNNDCKEQVTVSSSPNKGEFATIGFWHNNNGQALINSFGKTSSGLTLANWLATTFPNLFGKNAPAFNVSSTTGTNLTGRSDSDVAAYFLSLFGSSGQKAYAQVLANALAVFATSTSLDTGSTSQSMAKGFGFTLSSGGSGSVTFVVPSSDWAAFGITSSSGATLTDAQLLALVNKYAVGGVLNGGNSTLISETNDAFNTVNNAGDISG